LPPPGDPQRTLSTGHSPGLIARPDAKKESKTGILRSRRHLQRTTVYLLENVSNEISATTFARRAPSSQAIHGLVSARVEDTFLNSGLYR